MKEEICHRVNFEVLETTRVDGKLFEEAVYDIYASGQKSFSAAVQNELIMKYGSADNVFDTVTVPAAEETPEALIDALDKAVRTDNKMRNQETLVLYLNYSSLVSAQECHAHDDIYKCVCFVWFLSFKMLPPQKKRWEI